MLFWRFYFPQKKNLKPFSKEQVKEILQASSLLRENDVTHYDFYTYISNVDFYYDPTIANTRVLGHTSFLNQDRVIVAPIIADALLWKSSAGIPNNELAMKTIIHELTHIQQMKDFKWYGWPIMNSPLIKWFTIEKWARQNAQNAYNFLTSYYKKQLRQKLFKKESS